MYDASKIVPGLGVFFLLMTFPLWYNAATGQASVKPDPKIVTEEKQCVEPKEFMRSFHTGLLTSWREEVVRSDSRTYFASDGKTYEKSLSNTCLKCHSNRDEFCDRCHNYAQVQPDCWDCHSSPKGNN